MADIESKIFGVSMRGWITLIIVIGTFVLAWKFDKVREVIPYGFTAAIGYYYGQKSMDSKNENPPA